MFLFLHTLHIFLDEFGNKAFDANNYERLKIDVNV